MSRLLIAIATLALTVAAQPTPAPPPPALAAPAADENDPRWHPLLQKLAEGYRGYGRIDDESRFAPELCRMPQPGDMRWSKAEKDSAHAAKLYTLYVKDAKSYGARPTAFPKPVAGDESCAQVVVKEAWRPEKMETPPDSESFARPATARTFGPSGLRPAERGGSWYRAKEPLGLFIMAKLDPKTPDTDGGWVYGTITADGKKVTAAGRMTSCMGCHTKAGSDRLFGLPSK